MALAGQQGDALGTVLIMALSEHGEPLYSVMESKSFSELNPSVVIVIRSGRDEVLI